MLLCLIANFYAAMCGLLCLNKSWNENQQPLSLTICLTTAIIFKPTARGFDHNPAYFDDVPDISITKLFFQFDRTGLHLVDSMHELEMKAI